MQNVRLLGRGKNGERVLKRVWEVVVGVELVLAGLNVRAGQVEVICKSVDFDPIQYFCILLKMQYQNVKYIKSVIN